MTEPLVKQSSVEPALTNAYAEGRADEREQWADLLAWAYAKLHRCEFNNQDDALNLDRMKLMLTGAP